MQKLLGGWCSGWQDNYTREALLLHLLHLLHLFHSNRAKMIHVSQSHPLFLTKYTFWFCRSIRRSTDRTRSYLEILEQWFVFFHGPGEKKGTEFAIRPQKRCINLQIKKLGWQSQLLYLGHVWKDSFIKSFPWFWLFLVILFHSASPVKHFVMVLHLNCMTKRRTWNYFIMDMQLWPPSHRSNHFLLLTWMCLHVFGGLIEKQAMPFTKILSVLCLLLKLSRFTMEIKM